MGWRENFRRMGGHPGFIDMEGKRIGVLKVLRRGPNTGNGNAQWSCQCARCGAVRLIQGITLRSCSYTRGCPSCRKRRAA